MMNPQQFGPLVPRFYTARLPGVIHSVFSGGGIQQF
jgi:hypothetical protein